jgi:cell division protein FtsB
MEIKTLRYENLTALLVESIKEQQKQIDALKARVATLEAA